MDLGTNGWKTFFQALPINRAPKIYVVQAHETGKQELIDYYGFQQVRNAQFKSRLKVEHLVGDSMQSTLALLKQHGLERHLMPRSLGGNYDYSKFDNWVRSRMTTEASLAMCPVRINFVSYNNPSTQSSKDIVCFKSRRTEQMVKRYRDDVATLADTCRAMKSYKRHLEMRNNALEDALAAARKLVESHNSTTTTTRTPTRKSTL